MREKQFEECSLEEATHVKMDGLIYTFGDGNVEKIEGGLNIYMKHWNNYLSIFVNAFPNLGIKPLREVKLKSFDWEGEFDYPNYCRDCGSAWHNCICTGIIEEEDEE